MSEFHKLRVLTEHHGLGRVFLDDKEMHGVKKLEFSMGVNEHNKLNIELIIDSAEIDYKEVIHEKV
ncbi:MAG: hypothetical protein GY782_08445 [Gammaproteobacteria bacterium]|nr:hypothetical protein [Gammaproteobacteria bacterium]